MMSKKTMWYHGWVIVENPKVIREGKSHVRNGVYKILKDDKEPYAFHDCFYFHDIRSIWNDRHREYGVISFKNRRKNEIAFTKIVEVGLEDVGELINAFNQKMERLR